MEQIIPTSFPNLRMSTSDKNVSPSPPGIGSLTLPLFVSSSHSLVPHGLFFCALATFPPLIPPSFWRCHLMPALLPFKTTSLRHLCWGVFFWLVIKMPALVYILPPIQPHHWLHPLALGPEAGPTLRQTPMMAVSLTFAIKLIPPS